MHCPECHAPIPPRAEFCRECGTPTRESLRERVQREPAARTDDEVKRGRRNVLVIGAVFLFGLLIGGQSSWFGSMVEFEAGDHDRRPAVIAAQPLFEAFRDDADAAEDRFDDRYLIVTGEFIEVRPDDDGDPDLRFRTSDPDLPLGIDLVRDSYDQAGRLRPGQTVTVACERVVQGRRDNWLRNCSIEAVAEASGTAPAAVPALEAPAAAPAAEAEAAPGGAEAEAGAAEAAEKGQ